MDLFKAFLIKVPVREKLVPRAVFLSAGQGGGVTFFLTLILGSFGWRGEFAGWRREGP